MHPCVPAVIVTVVLLLVNGCGLLRTHPPEPSTALPITNVASVAGQWKGHAKTVGHLRSNASVRIGIASGGRYVIWRDGSQEIETDAGRLSLVDGTLRSDAGRWPWTFALYQRYGNPILVGEIRGQADDQQYVELVPDSP